MLSANLSVKDFVTAVGARFAPTRPQSFWDCEDLFRCLLNNKTEIKTRFNEELRRLALDPGHLGDWLPNEWVLWRGEGFVLSISLVDAPRRFIHVVPFYAIYGSLGTSDITYEKYTLPSRYRNDVFDPSIRLAHSGSYILEPDQHVRIESDMSAYDFRSVRPTPLLKFMTTAVRTLEWLFSKETMQAWQANDAYLRFTQLRVAADVLGKFAHQSSLEPLKALTEHPHHAVRWSAIQNLARLNRSEAIATLERAVEDPHIHVRTAARKTLERLQARKRGLS